MSGRGGSGDNRRVLRVEREIREVLSQVLARGYRAPEEGMITISRVAVSRDLRQARIYVSSFNAELPVEEIIENLQGRAPEFQDEINHRMRMKFCPKLQFYPDQSTDKVLHIEKVLREIGKTPDEDES